MLYLLDANTLIRANNEYYPIDRIPGFWAWLIDCGKAGNVKIPQEIAAEISAGKDAVSDWLKDSDVKAAMVLAEKVDVSRVRKVIADGYSPNLDEVGVQRIGRDPFLIAYALGRDDRTVVTKENSKPSAAPQNRKVPDACDRCKVRWLSSFAFYREADFRLP